MKVGMSSLMASHCLGDAGISLKPFPPNNVYVSILLLYNILYVR